MIFVFVFAVVVCGLIVADQIVTAAVMDAVTESVMASLQSISIGEEESHENAPQSKTHA